MKKHKIQHIIKKQGGNAQVVFRDGKTVFWPREYLRDIAPGTKVFEYKNKNNKTVAFTWNSQVRYVVPEPSHFDDALEFVENLKWFDRIVFNNVLSYAVGGEIMAASGSNTIRLAHNMMLLKIKTDRYKTR